ncbi:MAG: hypothetical protein AB8E15_12580 [Bdellovibrionales bacterium]
MAVLNEFESSNKMEFSSALQDEYTALSIVNFKSKKFSYRDEVSNTIYRAESKEKIFYKFLETYFQDYNELNKKLKTKIDSLSNRLKALKSILKMY